MRVEVVFSAHRLSVALFAMAAEELFDVVNEAGVPTGERRGRKEVHALGLYHRAVHTWLWSPSTNEILLQLRAACKDSWPNRWDISSAGHLSAGQKPLEAAVRELDEELGVHMPAERFEYLFTHLEKLASEQKGKPFINNEFNDVYLITVTAVERAALDPDSVPSPFRLQTEEVSAVQWLPVERVKALYAENDPSIVPCSDLASYGRLFVEIERRAAALATASAAAPAAGGAGAVTSAAAAPA